MVQLWQNFCIKFAKSMNYLFFLSNQLLFQEKKNTHTILHSIRPIQHKYKCTFSNLQIQNTNHKTHRFLQWKLFLENQFTVFNRHVKKYVGYHFKYYHRQKQMPEKLPRRDCFQNIFVFATDLDSRTLPHKILKQSNSYLFFIT